MSESENMKTALKEKMREVFELMTYSHSQGEGKIKGEFADRIIEAAGDSWRRTRKITGSAGIFVDASLLLVTTSEEALDNREDTTAWKAPIDIAHSALKVKDPEHFVCKVFGERIGADLVDEFMGGASPQAVVLSQQMELSWKENSKNDGFDLVVSFRLLAIGKKGLYKVK